MGTIKRLLFVFLCIFLGAPTHAGQWISSVFGPLFLQNISKKVLSKKFVLSRALEAFLLYIPMHGVSQNNGFTNAIEQSHYLENDHARAIIKEELGVDIKNIFVFKNPTISKHLAFTNNGCIFVSQKLIEDLLQKHKIHQNDSLAIIAHEYGHTLQKTGASEEYAIKHFNMLHIQTIAAFTILRSALFLKKAQQIMPTMSYVGSCLKGFLWGLIQDETTLVRFFKERRTLEYDADKVLYIKDPEKRLLILHSLSILFVDSEAQTVSKTCDFFDLTKEVILQVHQLHPPHKKRVQNIEHEKMVLLHNHPELYETLQKKD